MHLARGSAKCKQNKKDNMAVCFKGFLFNSCAEGHADLTFTKKRRRSDPCLCTPFPEAVFVKVDVRKH